MEYFTPINALSSGIEGDCIKNVLWQAINLPLPSSVENVVILCRTNNIPNDTPRDIANCIINTGSIFQKKSSDINVSLCGLILCDECWLVNRVLINEANKILKYQWVVLSMRVSGKFPYFFLWRDFTGKKKHKMQTTEIRHLLFRHF